MDKDQDLKHFHSFVSKLDGGAFNEELSEKMRECVQEITDACADRGGTHKARLTVTIDFAMNHKDKVVDIYPDAQTKLPKPPRGRAGMYYVDNDGNMTRQSPRQLSIEDELERKRLSDAEQAGNQ